MTESVLLPCSNCGAEISGGKETTKVVEMSDADGKPRFEFGGQPSVRELPAKVCPECGEVTAL